MGTPVELLEQKLRAYEERMRVMEQRVLENQNSNNNRFTKAREKQDLSDNRLAIVEGDLLLVLKICALPTVVITAGEIVRLAIGKASFVGIPTEPWSTRLESLSYDSHIKVEELESIMAMRNNSCHFTCVDDVKRRRHECRELLKEHARQIQVPLPVRDILGDKFPIFLMRIESLHGNKGVSSSRPSRASKSAGTKGTER